MLDQILNSQGLALETKIETLSFNHCYRVREQVSNRALFLKVLAATRSFFECGQEIQVQILASQAQLSPALVRYQHDHNCSWMLFEYIESQAQPSLENMITCLRKLHALPVSTEIKVMDPLVLASHYLDQAFTLAPKSLILMRLQEFLLHLSLPECPNFNLCHFDVHPHNFLAQAERTYMIDFENAGVFDPLYDLAVLGFYLGNDVQALKRLVDLYQAAEPSIAYVTCFAYQKICLCLFLCFLAYRFLIQDNALPNTDAYETQFSFSDLIRQYWQVKSSDLQTTLERNLFSLGLALL